MTRAAKVAILVAATLGSVIGAGCGIFEANALESSQEFGEIITASSVPSDFAARQFKYADTTHARQAVLLELGILQQLDRVAHDTVQAGKLAMAYARLAMIEETAGNQDAERAALVQAKVWNNKRTRGHAEITDEQLKNAVRTMDRVMDRVHR